MSTNAKGGARYLILPGIPKTNATQQRYTRIKPIKYNNRLATEHDGRFQYCVNDSDDYDTDDYDTDGYDTDEYEDDQEPYTDGWEDT